jgi:predicted ATPase/class 3 adenylate cyclase
MAVQPTGTVTLLFADVEASTWLLERLGRDAYAASLERHRLLLREAFARHGGYEVDCEGDAFFVAFAKAEEAVEAAGEAQRALAATEWPEGLAFHVRMGLHTGEPLAVPPKYVGMDVHRAARIAAAAHGGQTLLSQTTRDLLDDSFDIRDLGEHRLKDLSSAQRLYQLCPSGLPAAFPPLATPASVPTNLPLERDPFVGRVREIEAIVSLFGDEHARVVTLSGAGGSGKTRLALRAAAALVDRFEEGVFFVPLAPVRDADLVVAAIAQTLGVRARAGLSLADALSGFLAKRRLLLVLDNFEQVVAAAPDVGGLVSRCPHLRVLVTSRERLRLAGERVYPVAPLPVPTDAPASAAALAENEAVSLFVARAASATGDFALTDENASAVGAICRAVDGLPLAIELAAARAASLTPAALLSRLDRGLTLLRGGLRDADERQQTLERTIAWSYELLSEPEQRAFARLSVFVGGWDLAAAEVVCEAEVDTLHSLIEKSLVRRSDGRYAMLETIREYARGRLQESGSGDHVARRHAEYFVGVAEEALPHQFREDAALWIEQLAVDHDNLRAALTFARDIGDAELLLRLAGALGRRFWSHHGDLREGRGWLETALAAGEIPPAARALALAGIANLSGELGDQDAMVRWAEEELRYGHATGDAVTIHHGFANLGIVANERGEFERARLLHEESAAYARVAGSTWGLANAVGHLAAVALEQRDFEQALVRSLEAAAFAEEVGDRHIQAWCLGNVAIAALRLGRVDAASDAMRTVVEIEATLSPTVGLLVPFFVVAAVAVARGQSEAAARLVGAADRVSDETGYVLLTIDAETADLVRERIRAELGGRAEALFAAGRDLSREDAIACALESLA